MVADHRFRALEIPRGVMLELLRPVHTLADWPLQKWQGFSELVASREYLARQNKLLEEENRQLQIQQQQLIDLRAENHRLSDLLHATSVLRKTQRYQLARVVRVALDPHSQMVQIGLGRAAGVFPGQPVLSSGGIFGQVIHVGSSTAQILLITDSRHALPVVNQRSGQRGVAYGDGASGLLRLPYMPAHADLIQGDMLLSSGLGGRFPRGYPVARIRSVAAVAGENFAEVVAQPVVDPDRVQEVLLIWSDSTGETGSALAPLESEPADAGSVEP